MQKSRKTAEMPVILILTFLICGLLLTEKRVFASPQGQTFNTDRTEDTDGGEGEGCFSLPIFLRGIQNL